MNFGRVINASSNIMCNGLDVWTPTGVETTVKGKEQTLEIPNLTDSKSKVLTNTVTDGFSRVRGPLSHDTKLNVKQDDKHDKEITGISGRRLESMESVSSGKFKQGEKYDQGTKSVPSDLANDYHPI